MFLSHSPKYALMKYIDIVLRNSSVPIDMRKQKLYMHFLALPIRRGPSKNDFVYSRRLCSDIKAEHAIYGQNTLSEALVMFCFLLFFFPFIFGEITYLLMFPLFDSQRVALTDED